MKLKKFKKRKSKYVCGSLMVFLCLIISLTFKYSYSININDGDEILIDKATNTNYRSIYNENNIGDVWTDKSVFSSDINLDGTNIKKNADEDFLVSLQATSLGIDLNLKEGNVKDIVLIQDLTGSMADNEVSSSSGGKITRLQASKNAINELLTLISKANDSLSIEDEKFRVSLIGFSGKNNAHAFFDLTEVKNSNLESLKSKVNGMGVETRGVTYISPG